MSDQNPISDEMLMRLLIEGDPFAIDSLYERHSRKLYSLALRIVGDPQGAEEVMQDTFFQLWRRSSQFDSERGSLIGWLLTITRNRAIARIREQKERVQCESLIDDAVVSSQNTSSTVLDEQIARQLVSAAFAGLSDVQSKAITLAYFEGFTCEEIASRTQTPVGTTKTRLRSALKTMKRTLSNPIASVSADLGTYPTTLQDILITEQLLSRARKERSPRQEKESLDTLAEVLAASPNQLINSLLQMPIDLCGAGTAGLSLLETNSDEGQVFRWINLKGKLANHVGGTTPRNFSPCGVTLDCDSPQLFEYPARYFDYFGKVDVPIVEGLVIPFHVGDRTEGTIWIVSHDAGIQFDSEDARIMTSLAEFTGCALHIIRSLGH